MFARVPLLLVLLSMLTCPFLCWGEVVGVCAEASEASSCCCREEPLQDSQQQSEPSHEAGFCPCLCSGAILSYRLDPADSPLEHAWIDILPVEQGFFAVLPQASRAALLQAGADSWGVLLTGRELRCALGSLQI